ncbi:MAG: rhodanese-like domain-containing protein [Candidatus Sericytochromatia bacterium]|nr:rhodanese-like domain-containing protein [Candidatus Sericytochromatia bacterium]
MRTWILNLTVALTTSACAPAWASAPLQRASQRPLSPAVSAQSLRDVSPAEAARFLQAYPQAAFLDVRQPDEYAAGHARGAQLRPLGELATWAGSLQQQQPVVLICRSGSRSAKAAQALQARGFQQVLNIQGGTLAWEAAGLAMDR